MKHAQFVKTLLAIAAMVSLTALNAWGSTYKVIYSFTGGQDGANPVDAGTLAIDANGNLYGTTQEGGSCGGGTLFQLSPNGSGGWTETVLHSFCGPGTIILTQGDGAAPSSAPTLSPSGAFSVVLLGNTTLGGRYGEGTEFAYGDPPPYYSPTPLECAHPPGCFPTGARTSSRDPPTFRGDGTLHTMRVGPTVGAVRLLTAASTSSAHSQAASTGPIPPLRWPLTPPATDTG